MYLILVGGVVSTIEEGRNGLCPVKNKNSQETDFKTTMSVVNLC